MGPCMVEYEYTHGHHEKVVAAHARRRAENSAAFLLPYLDASSSVLDVGCGPGSITLDLAAHVSRVEGIDVAEGVIATAEASRAMAGIGNVAFRCGDVARLPYEDATFDVVYAHQVLQHLSDPVSALREMRRVLKPGGIAAVRDADYGTMVHAPHSPPVDEWLLLYMSVARRHGGEPEAGRHLSQWVAAAGFVDLRVSTSTWTYADSTSVNTWRDLWVDRLLDAKLGSAGVEMGLADRDKIERLAEGWRTWAMSATPFFAFLHGEVVAIRPEAE